ncbi:hypothetical protein FRC11_010868 [Ceratobasidium sp. 423]|nr:hypothetical protein FRC11_010868 [Ceratobasidium sp. 423]
MPASHRNTWSSIQVTQDVASEGHDPCTTSELNYSSSSYQSPMVEEGMHMSGTTMSRGYHDGVNSSYTPRDNPTIDISEPLWGISGGSHDLHGSREFYNSALMETPVNVGQHPARGSYQNAMWSTPSVSHAHDQFQEMFTDTGLYLPNPAITPPINPQNPETVASHPGPQIYVPESYHYGQQRSSIPPISPIRTNRVPPAGPPGSEPYSPGGTRRTRRPNVCDICGKEVRRPGVLEDHMNSHTGQRRE